MNKVNEQHWSAIRREKIIISQTSKQNLDFKPSCTNIQYYREAKILPLHSIITSPNNKAESGTRLNKQC